MCLYITVFVGDSFSIEMLIIAILHGRAGDLSRLINLNTCTQRARTPTPVQEVVGFNLNLGDRKGIRSYTGE